MLMLAAALPASAAEVEVVRLSVGEAVSRALDHAPELAARRAEHRAAEAGAGEAAAARRPEVDLLGSYTRRSDVPELSLDLPGVPRRTIFNNVPDNWMLRVEATVPVYTGERLPQLEQAAQREARARADDVEAGRGDIALEARRVYWNLVTARANVRVLAAAVESFDAHLADARNRKRFGLAARNEVLAVEVERERAQLARMEAERGAAVLEADLVRLTGLPPGARVEPTAELTPPSEAGADAARGGGDLLAAAVADDGLEPLVEEALRARPERKALEHRIEAAARRAGAARAGDRPTVEAVAGWDYARPNRHVLPIEDEWNDTWDISLRARLNVWDGGRTEQALARAEARTAALEARLRQLDEAVRQEVTSRRLALRTAVDAIDVAEQNVVSAREGRRVAADRYREGVIPSSELLDAEVALLRAGLDRTEAIARARLALAALERAVGRLP
jgi:outer membrane protein TolC